MKLTPINIKLLIIIMFIFYKNAASSQDLSKLNYEALDSLAAIEYRKSALDKAIFYMQAGRDKAKKEFGEMDSTYAAFTDHLGFFYAKIGQYQKAESLHLQAKDIRAKIFGEEHHLYLVSLNNLATVYQSMGNYDRAEVLQLQQLNTSRKILGKNHPDYARGLNNLAGLYIAMGNYEKAESLYLQAKDIFVAALGDLHPLFAVSLSNLAYVYHEMGSYEKSESFYLQVINIEEKSLGKEHPDLAISFNGLASLYETMEDYSKAESLYIKAMIINKKVFGEYHPEFAKNLHNLAGLYQTKKEYEKSEKLYLQAKNINTKVLGALHPSIAANLNGLAVLYQEMKNYEKAEEMYIKVIAFTKKILNPKNPRIARSLNSLAHLYQDMGKLDTALVYCKLSIVTLSEDIDSTFEDWTNLDKFKYFSNEYINKSIGRLLSIIFAQYKKTGDRNKLELHYQITQAAMRLNERIRNDFSAEGDKLRSLETSSFLVLKGIKTGIELAKEGYQEEAFGFAEMNKGVLLMDAAKTSNAYKFGDLPDSVATQEKQLQKKYASLEAKLLEKNSKTAKDSLINILNKTKLDITAFTQNLKTKYPKYIALKYESQTASAKDIQALLDDKTALLEYVIGDSVVYVFYVDKSKVILIPKQISTIELGERIKDFHSTLSNYELITKDKKLAYRQYSENAFWFYENLVAPALKNANGITKLIIISDGELGHLPYEAFLTKPAPQKETDYNQLNYLVNDYKISYNYSATLWKANSQESSDGRAKNTTKPRNAGQILAMSSNYDIKLDSTKSSWRLPTHQHLRGKLGALPAARKEVETLAATFNGFFAFDKDASEKVFKEKAGDYAIIHLAMHGLLDAKGPILSSLAFTEDGDSVENNFLHAYEISKMKLNADLVVLSACETGYGRFDKGNGIASLAQAFAYAGAPAMVVTLWQVNDYATSEMMKNLYQNLADGMKKDEALQQAKIQYMKNAEGFLAHPAFWSPFILMGNTDAIVVEKRRAFSVPLAIGIGLAIFVLGAGLFWKKKKE